MSEFGGLARTVPLLAVVFMITMLSSAGLPGLNGFIGELLILLAAFSASPLYAAFAATGVILGAVYLFHLYQKVMFGPVTKPENHTLPDLSLREAIIMIPIIALMVIMGLFPNPILRRTEPSMQKLLVQVNRAAAPLSLHGTPQADGGVQNHDH
jgi:NADH-quinone oxidoreductase subunit M